jgi:acyl dehydratase
MKALHFSDIRIGQTKSRRYLLTKDVYGNFLAAFGDTNPLHIDDGFAKKKGFKSKVMHGAILNGFISHFIGVCFPGRHALLQSVSIQYRAPVYLGDALLLRCRVEHKSKAAKTLSFKMTWYRTAPEEPVATAKAQVGMTA